jgi:hypothetical protein
MQPINPKFYPRLLSTQSCPSSRLLTQHASQLITKSTPPASLQKNSHKSTPLHTKPPSIFLQGFDCTSSNVPPSSFSGKGNREPSLTLKVKFFSLWANCDYPYIGYLKWFRRQTLFWLSNNIALKSFPQNPSHGTTEVSRRSWTCPLTVAESQCYWYRTTNGSTLSKLGRKQRVQRDNRSWRLNATYLNTGE